jgi:signal peptidase II
MGSIRGPALIAAVVLVCDQWTKHWATIALQDRSPLRVVGDLVRLTYTRNSGVAFGMGAGSHFPYWIFSVAASIAIIALLFLRPELPALRRAALGLVLGGAIGNLIDRVRFGEVVDFILLSWRHWQFPVFNVADSAVTVGVVIFALTSARPAAEPEEATGREDATAP